ncbi:hypothetical protein C5Y96_12255 [Blastopirellula marina]|uniref:Uncharacterized protein n=1 Tax=Blastopirellula marina TaxID=124 RepID=A0A2S8FG25_9BACT|nr:hypothetical protein C5Y96_12255 [Blastopirellula marina]RCS51517.1 hypothetical protein DTL36_12265 [Bremerella cremea]
MENHSRSASGDVSGLRGKDKMRISDANVARFVWKSAKTPDLAFSQIFGVLRLTNISLLRLIYIKTMHFYMQNRTSFVHY